MSASIGPASLKALLGSGEELALLDVREAGSFGEGHLLYACNLPLSRMELRIRALVPRWKTPLVLCDGGEGLAERAARRLRGWGYGDTRVLAGGLKAWSAAGYELFSGLNVPSKAFGELVEHRDGTPSVSAAELNEMISARQDLVILDSRPMAEYALMNIPGGVNVPGADLVLRAREIAPDPATTVVVNCAGRTRSIIGAQSLRAAGLPNPVVALRNGTMGWHLSGFQLESGQSRNFTRSGAESLRWAREAARMVAERYGVESISGPALERWRQEAPENSLGLFDVRLPEEYEQGHLAGSRSAPGGQLVQATDTYLGTRNARIVLIDDDGVRAFMTASWLVRMGWKHTRVLDGGLSAEGLESVLETGPEPVEIPGLPNPAPEEIEANQLSRELETGAVLVVDLASSPNYGRGHIPGAWFAIRATLAEALVKLPTAKTLVLTSPDGMLAGLAAAEVASLTRIPVKVLKGGTAEWKVQNLPLEKGTQHMAVEPDDAFLRPYDRDFGVEAAMQAYLDWEVNLIGQLERDGDAPFLKRWL